MPFVGIIYKHKRIKYEEVRKGKLNNFDRNFTYEFSSLNIRKLDYRVHAFHVLSVKLTRALSVANVLAMCHPYLIASITSINLIIHHSESYPLIFFFIDKHNSETKYYCKGISSIMAQKSWFNLMMHSSSGECVCLPFLCLIPWGVIPSIAENSNKIKAIFTYSYRYHFHFLWAS